MYEDRSIPYDVKLEGLTAAEMPQLALKFHGKNNFYLPAQKYYVCTRKEIVNPGVNTAV
jgi:hypothetical protein